MAESSGDDEKGLRSWVMCSLAKWAPGKQTTFQKWSPSGDQDGPGSRKEAHPGPSGAFQKREQKTLQKTFQVIRK